MIVRVPDAVRHSSCRSAEPGPYQTPAPVTAPALQRTASQGLRAALRPGNDVRVLNNPLLFESTIMLSLGVPGASGFEDLARVIRISTIFVAVCMVLVAA